MTLSAKNWKVYAGVVSLKSLPHPYLVKKILLSENYDNKTNDQDVALLKLASPVAFNSQSQIHLIGMMFHPVCIPEAVVRMLSSNQLLVTVAAMPGIGPSRSMRRVRK